MALSITASTPLERARTVSFQSSEAEPPADSNEERCRAGLAVDDIWVLRTSRIVSVDAIFVKLREDARLVDVVDFPTPLVPLIINSLGTNQSPSAELI